MSKPEYSPASSMMPKPGSVSLPPQISVPRSWTAARMLPSDCTSSTVSVGSSPPSSPSVVSVSASVLSVSASVLSAPSSVLSAPSSSLSDEHAPAMSPSAMTAAAVRFQVEAFPLLIM